MPSVLDALSWEKRLPLALLLGILALTGGVMLFGVGSRLSESLGRERQARLAFQSALDSLRSFVDRKRSRGSPGGDTQPFSTEAGNLALDRIWNASLALDEVERRTSSLAREASIVFVSFASLLLLA